MTASSEETVNAVTSFLAGADCRNQGDALLCKANVGLLEDLFHTKFFVFTHTTGRKLVRHMAEISLPAALASHVDMITGLGSFPIPKHRSFVKSTNETVGPYGLLVRACPPWAPTGARFL